MPDTAVKFTTQTPGPTVVQVELEDGTKWEVLLNLNVFGIEEAGKDEAGTPKFLLNVNVATITKKA